MSPTNQSQDFEASASDPPEQAEPVDEGSRAAGKCRTEIPSENLLEGEQMVVDSDYIQDVI